MIRNALFAVLVGLSLVGCSTSESAHGPIVVPPGAGTASATRAITAAPIAEPTDVEIPRLGIKSSLIPLGLGTDGSLEVPDVRRPEQAGWYKAGSRPGEAGKIPAIIVGHVDGNGKQGVFYRLKELKPADEVLVRLADGRTLTFWITSVETDDKSSFPTNRVYGHQDHPALRLITCGGTFDPAHHNYLSNVIAFAELVG